MLIKVALSIMGGNEARQPAVQSKVRDIVGGKHQQVVRFFSPTNLILISEGRRRDYIHFLTVTEQRVIIWAAPWVTTRSVIEEKLANEWTH